MPSRRRPFSLSSLCLPSHQTSPDSLHEERHALARPISLSSRPKRSGTPTLNRTHEDLFPVTVTAGQLLLTLPVPPSINHQYATVNGRRLLSFASRSYKTQVTRRIWIALAQSPNRHQLMERFRSEPLALSICFYFTTSLRRDVDSGLKITQDAVCEGLGINDNRIVETHLYKRVDKLNPRIEVCLTLADSSFAP